VDHPSDPQPAAELRPRRVLIAGISSYVGGRLAQALEREPFVEAIIGVDAADPQLELDRTEFVRLELEPALLARILRAAEIDSLIDVRLIDDPLGTSLERVHQVNVTGTRNILAAISEADSPVRKLVFKSSAHYYGCDRDDPAFFGEDSPLSRGARTSIERDLVEAEAAVREFAARAPARTVTVLRFTEGIGSGLHGSHLSLLGLPMVPSILGFDPRWQFIHEDDIIGVLRHCVEHDLAGSYNAAADGVLAFSEVVSLLGKPLLPLLPPWGTVIAAAQLRRLGVRVPLEMLRLMRFGRAVDNRRLKATGFAYRYTSREAVLKLRAQQRLRPLLRSGGDGYRYEREVEEFLRRSPSVHSAPSRRSAARSAAGNGPALGEYDELSEEELIDVISSLEPESLARLRHYEVAHGARSSVLDALDRALARRSGLAGGADGTAGPDLRSSG
jgi:UDP-glucose 4-epimerase